MACAGINTLGMATMQWWGVDALQVLRLMDVSGAGSINSNHLKTLKNLYGDVQDFSKFDISAGSGVDTGADSGANGTWAMSASTAPTLRWVELEQIVNTIMQQAVTVHAHAHDTLINFIGGEFIGILLANEGKTYAMTAPFKELNNELNWDLNGLNCQQDPMANLPPTLITNVYYKANDIAEAITINPFDNARMVVNKALGAVNAAALLEQIYNRSANQSIRYVLRERNVAEYLIRRSNKVWNLVQRGIPKAANFREIGVIDTANLEKLRSRLDETDMKIYNAPAKASADDKFATLKALSTQMVEIISDGGFTAGSIPGVGLPLSFTEWLNVLTRLLNEEKAEAYPVNVWAARLETYRLNLGRIVNVLREYAMGRLYQLTAIERAKKPDFPTIEECMTGTGNAPAPIPGPTPANLQAAADVLSQVAFVNGQLERAKFRELISGRELSYAFKTRRVIVDGKKRTLTIIKVKESGIKPVYVAQFVDNGYELITNGTAWCGVPSE